MAATEVYTNNATTTVALAADAPASGTSESWVVASSTGFPAASTGVTQFHVGDPAAPSELIAVTNVAGTTWTVTRGAENTTPVTHAAGYTLDQVITAGGLNGLVSSASATAFAVVTGGTAVAAPFQTVSGVGSSGQVLVSNGAGALPSFQAQNYGGVFGSGSDGSVTFDGTTTTLGLVPAASTYTMTRDIQCTGITINSGVVLKPSNFRLFCRGTLTNNGTISVAGNNASGAAAGASQGAGSVTGGRAGGAGGTGVSGTGGTAVSSPFGVAGGAGGAGTSGAAGPGGTVTISGTTAANGAWITPFPALVGTVTFTGNNLQMTGGPGGGGGGSDASSNAGGGGGSGGGMIVICAYAANNGGGTITAIGGNGANGTGGNAGGGGGGSGGFILAYTLSAWTAGTTIVTGGTKGTHAGTGSDGNNGGAGTVLNVVLA